MDIDAHPDSTSDGAALTPRQKAAVIVSLALAEGVELPLQDMPRALQEVLARQIAGLGALSDEALRTVVTEFTQAIEAMATLPSGVRAALRMLDGRVDPEALAPLRGPIAPADPWERVGRLDVETLLPVIRREAIEVAAMIVSRLPTDRAAEILSRLPGPHARRIAFAVSRITDVDPGLAGRIGSALVDEVGVPRASASGGGAERRVGAILNVAPSRTRDDVLAGLREDDAAFADAVRRTIFTFADIDTRLAANDVAGALRGVDDATQAAALAAGRRAGHEAAVEHVLANLPKRMAERLREAMAEWSGTEEEGEAAMSALCEVVRRQDAEGAIALKPVPD